VPVLATPMACYSPRGRFMPQSTKLPPGFSHRLLRTRLAASLNEVSREAKNQLQIVAS
jgi:hypothetical protein